MYTSIHTFVFKCSYMYCKKQLWWREKHMVEYMVKRKWLKTRWV